MPEHDAMSSAPHSIGWLIVCRCKKRFARPTEDQARAAHAFHHNAETVGKPGLRDARAALEGEQE